MLFGHIDRLDVETCAGWVFDADEPGGSVEVELLVNGDVVYRDVAELERVDVESIHGVRACGFSFGMTPYIVRGKNEIDVRVAGRDFAFAEMPRFVDPRSAIDFIEFGKDGWLFLQNDANDVPGIVAGRYPLPPEDLEHICDRLEERERRLGALGIRSVFYIVPEKSAMLGEMRNGAIVSDDRPAVQLARRAAERGIGSVAYRPEVLFPDVLDCFDRDDTHVNAVGMLRLLDDMLRQLGVSTPLDVDLVELPDFFGDLGKKMPDVAARTSLEIIGRYEELYRLDTVEAAIDNNTRLRGSTVTFRARKPDGIRCLLYGTSSAYYSREAFFSICSELDMTWSTRVDLDRAEKVRPDLLVNLVTERTISRTVAD